MRRERTSTEESAPGHSGAGELEGLAKTGSEPGSHRDAGTEGTL